MTTKPFEPDADRWDAFVDWARRFFEWGGLAETEIEYKLKTGDDLAGARDSFLRGSPDWRDTLSGAASQPYLLWWGTTQAFQLFLESDVPGSEDAIGHIWAPGDTAPQELLSAFAERMEAVGAGIRGLDNLGSFLLMARGAREHPYYQYTPLNAAYRLTGYPRISTSATAAAKYSHALDFLDDFIRQAGSRGLEVPDRLHAQSLVWCVVSNDPLEEWTEAEQAAFRAYRDGEPPPPPQDRERKEESGTRTGPDWPRLASDLLWEHAQLAELIADLEDKRQLIFYGPPGTGKTYVAKQIAAEYERTGGGTEIVQFHPSYSYEDFVEGYRPALIDGQPGFTLTAGPLKRIAAAAEKATANPDTKFVLVIDELNRGNVAKVFGELYFLLEYRNEAMKLQYDAEPFELPANLLFICTMNTADRSIALVDAALRRRFWFEGFFPDQAPIEGLLRRWLAKNQPGAEWVADLVDRANMHLGDRDAAIGPSYFMDPDHDLDEERVRRIWRRAVRPYVEEQCYGEDEKLASLEYERLRSELAADRTPPAGAPSGGEGATVEPEAEEDDADPS